ncbi:hypothetical protein SLA2020_147820 [Shorea laevis]
MGDQSPNPETPEPKSRPVGGTEYSWCRAVPGGTGTTVLTLLLSKPPQIPVLQDALITLQNSHPILRSKLHFDAATNTFSFITCQNPNIQIEQFDLQSSSLILQSDENPRINPHHRILEHEMNKNAWQNPDHPLEEGADVIFASVYTLSESRWVVVLRLHTGACDRTAAVAVLRELLELVGGGELGDDKKETAVGLAIEDLIPNGKANKPFWARGLDMLGYSLNSFRLANLNFVDIDSPRHSEVVRLQMNIEETERLVSGCKSRSIKLCGAIAAAGLIAAHSSKDLPFDQREKYAVVTLNDCRPILDPVRSSHHLGFYHSAILNTHDISGGVEFWDLAKRCYSSFANAKNYNKHFTDMNDLNFLMGKAIDNPGLTPASSMRTAFISVFEEPVIDESNPMHSEIGLEDYFGCASVHGVGPTLAVFDTIRDGGLDCACVYPAPLHSRDQMRKLIDSMKRILKGGVNEAEK